MSSTSKHGYVVIIIITIQHFNGKLKRAKQIPKKRKNDAGAWVVQVLLIMKINWKFVSQQSCTGTDIWG